MALISLCSMCMRRSGTAEISTLEHILCYCETCRKLGGGPYSMNQIIRKQQDALPLLTGSPSCYTYTGAPGNPVRCYFCPTCRSYIYHHQSVMGERIIVRTILLKGGQKMGLGGDIFQEGKLEWVDELREALAKEG